MVEHGGRREKGAQDKDETMLPETAKKLLVREHEDGEEDNENQGGDPKGNIGVESGPKNEASQEKVAETMSAESTEEEIKGLGEKHIVKVLGKGGFVRMGIRIKRIRTDFY